MFPYLNFISQQRKPARLRRPFTFAIDWVMGRSFRKESYVKTRFLGE
jgi:hypothetical protein